MEILTDKQKANRAYYAKNAEKIRAKKRAQYAEEKDTNPKPKKFNFSTGSLQPTLKKKAVKITVSQEDLLKMQARRRIENLRLARELGLGVEDL